MGVIRMSVLAKVASGLVERVRAVEDWWFDRTRRVDTAGEAVPHKAKDAVGPVRDGNIYQPSRARNVRTVLRELPIKEPGRYTFVDIGSGKGRVLFLAAEMPFRKVIGVEYSAGLHRAAEENLRRFRRPQGGCAQVEVVQADAAAYVFPAGRLVVFLANPFGPEVMRQMLRNLEESAEKEPRHVVVALLWPELGEMVAKMRGARLSRKTRRFEVYELGG
jgi:SAM-dependent methyltransferase